jgi:hypothetical protein
MKIRPDEVLDYRMTLLDEADNLTVAARANVVPRIL